MPNDMKATPKVTPTSTHWGTYFAETVRRRRSPPCGTIRKIPDPAVIGPGMVDMIDHPTRISQPMVRKSLGWKHGPDGDRTLRGKEPFVAVGWDRALDHRCRPDRPRP